MCAYSIHQMSSRRTKKNRANKKRKRGKRFNTLIPLLAISPLVFTTNVVAAIYKSNYLYATALLTLILTSIEFHSNPSRSFIGIFDRIAVYLVVCYGWYTFYNLKLGQNAISHLWRGLILSTFFFCIWVYYYGYVEKQLCFHPNKEIGDRWHAIMHIIGSIGHNMIILST